MVILPQNSPSEARSDLQGSQDRISALATQISEQEKVLKQAKSVEHEVSQKMLNVQKEILQMQAQMKELQIKKHDFRIAHDKARHNVQQIALDIMIMKGDFFNARG